jgi:hypothetical protein
MALNKRMPQIDPDRFSMVPRSDVPRSTFTTSHAHKTTFDAGRLVPIYLDEVLPGDTHKGSVTIFARLATPLFPIMDAIRMETFFFFIPNRLVWSNWKKLMGERINPADSISYTVPQVTAPTGGYPLLCIADYMGLPTAGQMTAGLAWEHNALPIRGYYLVYNEWFRDQNLQDTIAISLGDGPDLASTANVYPLRRNKKHDYFTSALPWPLKGGDEVTIGGGGNAPVMGIAFDNALDPANGSPGVNYRQTGDVATTSWLGYVGGAQMVFEAEGPTVGAAPYIYADLSSATGATINALRLAFQTQRLLERDARSGTRYTELLRSHFGVTPEDTRLQRPEYIGGGKNDFNTQAIPQTSATGLTGGTSPLGALGAAATSTDQHSFSYSATEHGFIIGLAHVTAELTYQQGLHKMWSRETRYDYYFPVFAHLGEQAILNRELYITGNTANDDLVFGYQERWAEYRHRPSRITGLFKSTSSGNIDEWHLAQQFSAAPVLNTSFIQDDPPFPRVLAAGSLANGQQVLFDSVFRIRSTRAMPMYSVPGQIDRF